MTTLFGLRLQDALAARGWSQGQLELHTGQMGHEVSQATISRIVRGRVECSLENAVAIARALGASLDDMCGIRPLTVDELTPTEAEIVRLARLVKEDLAVLDHLHILERLTQR